MTHSLNVLRDDLGVRFGISGHVSSTYDGNAEGEPQLTERHRYERRDQQGEHHDLDDLLIVTSESSAAKKNRAAQQLDSRNFGGDARQDRGGLPNGFEQVSTRAVPNQVKTHVSGRVVLLVDVPQCWDVV